MLRSKWRYVAAAAHLHKTQPHLHNPNMKSMTCCPHFIENKNFVKRSSLND